MNKTQAKAIREAVIEVFQGRRGFEWWWDNLSSKARSDIKADLLRIIASATPDGGAGG